jgi:hypothetical protein
MTDQLLAAIKDMKDHTDLYPWYWLSYGEKCYAFAVVAAYPLKEGDKYPRPGTELEYTDDDNVCIGENEVLMLIDSEITYIERQEGQTICQFIAAAHAELLGDQIKEISNE